MLSWVSNHLYTDLRAPVSTLIGATDASPEGLSATEAKVSKARAERLYLTADVKGDRVSLGGVLNDSKKKSPDGQLFTTDNDKHNDFYMFLGHINPRVVVAMHIFSGEAPAWRSKILVAKVVGRLGGRCVCGFSGPLECRVE